jgi:iron complex outermembrane receptor protein
MKMSSTDMRLRAKVSIVVAACAAACAAPAFAQQSATPPSQSGRLETVVVTGSRIARIDAAAESPIVTVTAEQIKQSGISTVEQFLNTLPQITPGLSSQSNNPSSNGRAFIDLRGLGSGRNLILINGKRGMGSTGGGTVDTNTIPTALIERVEVITGGAATTYGADAVSGVVNFILKKNFKGIELDAQTRQTEQSDGKETSASLTMGGTFEGGRGSAVFSAGYFKRDAIYKGARAFSAQASNTTGIFPGGSISVGTNAPTQAAVDAIFGANTCNTNGGQAGFGFNPDGTLFCTGVQGNANRNMAGYTGPESHIATAFAPDLFSYNFEPDNILVLPMERWSLYSAVNLDVNDHFRPYATVQFTNYNALQELAPTPGGGFTIPTTNPFWNQQALTLLATRANPTAAVPYSKRFNSLGGRTGYNTHDVWQLVTGATGDVVGDWTYDFHATYGRSVQNEVQGGNVRVPRLQALLNAADGGASLCAGGFNPFGPTPLSAACSSYIGLQAKNLTTVVQRVVEASVQGPVAELPAGSLDAVVGASYRDLEFDFQPDSGLQPGQVVGFNEQLPVKGDLDFQDFFAEAVIPILKDLPLVKSLSATVGARVTDSNISGRDNSYKATLDWAVTDKVRFRGGYQTAIRAPNVNELFAPQLNNFPTFTNQDPCNTTGAIAATYRNGTNGAQVQALCAAQSPVAGGGAYVQPFGQARGIVGGNPNLGPEKAKSFTAGLVFQPSKELTATVDYWSIELTDVIGGIEAATIVQRCFNRDGANPTYSATNPYCQFFTRDQNDGGVINLSQLQRNQAFRKVSGLDLALDFGLNMGNLGALRWNVNSTWLEKDETSTAVTPNDPVNDFVGTIGATTGSAIPKWRFNLSTTYSLGGLSVQLVSRWIDKMVHANTVTGGSPTANTGTAATWYHDLSARYAVTPTITVRAGVSNLLDQEPRLYTPNIQANTDPSTFDVLGRRYFVGVNARF